MNSLKETGAISIDYINHEVRQKLNNDKESEDSAKDLIQELKEENHVHPNILLYIVIIVIIIGLTCAFVYIVMNKNNIRPYTKMINFKDGHLRQRHFLLTMKNFVSSERRCPALPRGHCLQSILPQA